VAQQRHSRRHRALIAVLIQAREAAGLSQRDVCSRLKRPINFAHLVELGERMLSAVELPDYAKAVGLAPEVAVTRMLELERSNRAIPPRVDARSKRRKGARSRA
jgi:transcriptional regulator with XRE-family HTH domain